MIHLALRILENRILQSAITGYAVGRAVMDPSLLVIGTAVFCILMDIESWVSRG